MAFRGIEGDPRQRGAQEPQGSIGTLFKFGDEDERVVTRPDFPLSRAEQNFEGRPVLIGGYGKQGPAQAKNLEDNGVDVKIWQRESYSSGNEPPTSWEKALEDKWIPGKTLFSSLAEAMEATKPRPRQKPRQVHNLLSDAGQVEQWPNMKPFLGRGTNLDFSHGFGPTFSEQTGIIPPANIDVTLVAPKGAGTSLRTNYQEGKGTNSSYAVIQDATGDALEITLSTGMLIGSGFLFETTKQGETFSDLVGERGVLLGGVYGLLQAASNTLRENGFSPENSARHTIEVLTQVISKIIGEKGADGLIRDLRPDLLPWFLGGFRNALERSDPVFEDLYERVVSGAEAKRVIEANSLPDYAVTLKRELDAIANSEFGRAATDVRNRRIAGLAVPSQIENKWDAVMAGALVGIMHAQYDLLRRRGHKPSEAFNETVEEATESLYPLIDENGIDWMYAKCSTTAQRGALDWNERFRDALQPGLVEAYSQSHPVSRHLISLITDAAMWRAGVTVRYLRPENQRL